MSPREASDGTGTVDARRPLAGRGAVVTGASRGIGLAVARALGRAGARVAMLARDREALAAGAAEIGATALPVACDVTDPGEVERAIGLVARDFRGPPDILVNNAGLFRPRPVHETPLDEFARTIAVNLVAPFALARALLPAMRERGDGHIVTIGSIADRVVYPENAAYAASKFGARALHEVMRLELRGTGVRVTLVSPGPTDTPLWDAIGEGDFPARSDMLGADAVADAVLYALTRPAAVNVDELRLSSA